MAMRRIASPPGILLILATLTLAQNVATITENGETTTSTAASSPTRNIFGIPSSSSSSTPNDNAPSGNNNKDQNAGGLMHYYFVFFAIFLCCVGIALFILFRRKHRAHALMRMSPELGRQQDLNVARGRPWNEGLGNPRYWRERWRSNEDMTRDEGLNEHGEAPPPYVPKRRSEEQQHQQDGARDAGPEIPMQALSREQAGLKPPEYEETYSQNPDARAGASSSRLPFSQSRGP